MTATAKRIYIIAGEDSGDALGAALIEALRQHAPEPLDLAGLGGWHMHEQGIVSPFPLDEVAVMGVIAIAQQLPSLIRRAYQVIDDAIAFKPDLIVIIDSPEFTHPIARRLRKRLPGVPILDYVSPSVWAWRSWRARRMRAYIDEVLGLLPFEPQAYRDLRGPPCTYVGHPLIEALDRLRGHAPPKREAGPNIESKTVLILPGSRRSEVTRLMPIFREAVESLAAADPGLRFVIGAADDLTALVSALTAEWDIATEVVTGRDAREAAMRKARVAIAASGTVTLELALARVPMVVCYRLDWIAARFRFLVRLHSVVLPNLIDGGNDIPELIHSDCTVENIVKTAQPLIAGGAERDRQMTAFDRVAEVMKPDGPPPSARAAARVLHHLFGEAAA